MTEKYYNNIILIKIQQFAWYFAFVYFAIVALLYLIGYKAVDTFSRGGVIFVLAVTLIKIFVMAEQFRKAKLYRLCLLSFTLVIILLLIVVIRYFK